MVVRDMTARVLAEESAREANRFLEALIENVPVMVFVKDAERLAFQRLNRAGEVLLGRPREDVIGKTVYDLFPREQAEFLDRKDREALRSHEAVDVPEYPLEIRGGTRWLHTKEVSLRDSDGTARFVLGISEDVTERKRGEEWLRLATEAAPNAIVIVGRDGKIAMVNPQAEKLFGYSRGEMIGQAIETLVPARYRGAHLQQRAAFFADSETRTIGAGRDLFGLRKGGVEVPVEIGINPVKTPEGTFFVASIVDISERKAAEQIRRDVVRMLSHDIKNPLAVIRGSVDIAREELQTGGDVLSLLDAVERAADKAMGLALNFLEADKIETGQLRLRRDLISLNGVVEETLRHQTVHARGKKMTLRPDLEENLPLISVDGPLIGRVVANLVSNALKVSPEGGVVVVATRSTERTVTLSVRDRGPGIDMEALPKLFQRYSSAGQPRSDSTGLGLFVVRTVVEAHGGAVAVERNPEGGTSFTVTLPRSP